jgi:bacteriocin-like protein
MTTERELTESELASVSGGTLSLNYGTIEYEYGHQSSGSGGDPPPAKHWFNGG